MRLMCPRCGQEVTVGEHSGFACEGCGGWLQVIPHGKAFLLQAVARELPGEKEALRLVDKAVQAADPVKKKKLLDQAEALCPDSLHVQREKLYLGRLWQRDLKNIDYHLIKCYLLHVFEAPEQESRAMRESMLRGEGLEHTRSNEYASRIMEAMITNAPYKIGGNVINNGVIPNLPKEACVEVPCLVDANGVTPTFAGELPLQLAAMNASNIYTQLLTIEAARTGSRDTLYQAAMMDPVTGAQLSTDEIVAMCNELIEAHTAAGFPLAVK